MLNSDEVITANLRRRVEKSLGRRVPQNVWHGVIEDGHVAEFMTVSGGADALAALKAEVQRRLIATPARNGRPKATALIGSARPAALAIVATAEAGRRPDIASFRHDLLAGGLLALDDVPGWIESHAGRRGALLSFELLKDTSSAVDIPFFRTLKVRQSASLLRLRRLRDHLADQYAWKPWEATYVLLCADRPIRWPVLVSYATAPAAPALSRVILEIDPATPPSWVMARYRFARRSLVGPRHRSMSEKHIMLAAFVAQRPLAESLATQMAAWNRAYPSWRYSAVTNFGRDRIQARRRLIEPPYSPSPDMDKSERAASLLGYIDDE